MQRRGQREAANPLRHGFVYLKMNVVITDILLILNCYMLHRHAGQRLKLKRKYFCLIFSVIFHLALFPCQQSPRSILTEPWETGRHYTVLLRKEKMNPSMYCCDLQGQLCHAMPCHTRLRQASRLSPIPLVALGLCQPCPCFFLTPLYYIHPFLSPSLSPPSIWRDSCRAGPWSPSAHSHLIKRSHSTVGNVTDGC